MGQAALVEANYNCTPPAKTICHVYACGGNSILAGTLQYNSDSGGTLGLTAAQKAKYWDAVHPNIWRLHTNYCGISVNPGDFYLRYVWKEDEPLFITPEAATDQFSTPMIVSVRLYELYGGTRHIAICQNYHNGTGFRNVAGHCWNVAKADPIYNSGAETQILARQLDLTVRHLTQMGYDVRVMGIVMIGQSVIDVQEFNAATYSKAQFKLDLTAVIDYFRTTLGYTDVPFYMISTTQYAGYPVDAPLWDAGVTEVAAVSGFVYLQQCHHWLTLPDLTHPDGRTGVLAWGEGVPMAGYTNLAQTIYDIENP